jgi:hypothetical protein
MGLKGDISIKKSREKRKFLELKEEGNRSE